MGEVNRPPSHRTATEWVAMLRSAYPSVGRRYEEHIVHHPALGSIAVDVARAYDAIAESMAQGGTLYLCANGGSFADALHISGELLKSFILPRPVPPDLARRLEAQPHGSELAKHLQAGLRAHVLGANSILASAVANDIPVEGIGYAQELFALARPGDVLLGISTSGRARNVLLAVEVAKALGLVTIGLTGGRKENPLAAMVDIALRVPDTETYRIQELHIALYHQLCLMLEERFFSQEQSGVKASGSVR